MPLCMSCVIVCGRVCETGGNVPAPHAMRAKADRITFVHSFHLPVGIVTRANSFVDFWF